MFKVAKFQSFKVECSGISRCIWKATQSCDWNKQCPINAMQDVLLTITVPTRLLIISTHTHKLKTKMATVDIRCRVKLYNLSFFEILGISCWTWKRCFWLWWQWLLRWYCPGSQLCLQHRHILWWSVRSTVRRVRRRDAAISIKERRG